MSNNFHLQLYRGTTAQNNAYTGLAGEITADTQAGNIRLHDGSKAGGYVVASMPVGSIIPYAGTTIPDGYLLCDGSAISRTTYSALFTAIGTTYGEGDGNSTFNIPDSESRSFVYTAYSTFLGNLSNGYLPNITGSFHYSIVNGSNGSKQALVTDDFSGCFTNKSTETTRQYFNSTGAASGTFKTGVVLNAKESSSVYINGIDYVRPKCIIIYAIIKY